MIFQAKLLLLPCLLLTCFKYGSAVTYKTVGRVREAMYEEMNGARACYKLLNATGPVGCEVPGGSVVRGHLLHYDDLDNLLGGSLVVVVPAPQSQGFLQRLVSNSTLRQHVVGVLVDPSAGRPASHSTSDPFPLAEYAPYSSPSYVWNPYGSSLGRQYFGLPIYILKDKVINDTLARAQYNAEQNLKGAVHVADMELTMQAEHNSSYCIPRQQCLPVGGHSVWAALPHIPDPSYSSTPAKSITLVVAQVDSNALFHDLVQGANSPLSGLIAMLAALEILAKAGQAATYSRQLVFAAMAGEPWGYMGSKQLLWQIQSAANTTKGLDMALIDQVIEVGMVGKAYSNSTNTTQLYAHKQTGAAYGDTSALFTALSNAAAATSEAPVAVANAAASNPGIPPSSLTSFLRVKPSIAGLVLAEFDQQYSNAYHHSIYDDVSTIEMQSMVSTALLLARALHELASGPSSTPLQVDYNAASYTVGNLTLCMAADVPGLACPLVQSLIRLDRIVAADGILPFAMRRYVGVLEYIMPDPQHPAYKANSARFLWNLMGNLTATGEVGQYCDWAKNLCPEGQLCVGWRFGNNLKSPEGLGRCRTTSVNYVASHSTRFAWGSRGWQLSNDSRSWEQTYNWPDDPMWTESNWPSSTPALRMFQLESYDVQVAVLVSGLLLCLFTAVVAHFGRAAFEKHLKSH